MKTYKVLATGRMLPISALNSLPFIVYDNEIDGETVSKILKFPSKIKFSTIATSSVNVYELQEDLYRMGAWSKNEQIRLM